MNDSPYWYDTREGRFTAARPGYYDTPEGRKAAPPPWYEPAKRFECPEGEALIPDSMHAEKVGGVWYEIWLTEPVADIQARAAAQAAAIQAATVAALRVPVLALQRRLVSIGHSLPCDPQAVISTALHGIDAMTPEQRQNASEAVTIYKLLTEGGANDETIAAVWAAIKTNEGAQ
jgi:hypothetical protein